MNYAIWMDRVELRTSRPAVGRTRLLAETAEAAAYVGEGHARGNTVVIV